MIRVMLIDETIRMKVSTNQEIDLEQLKIIYKMGASIVKMYRDIPIVLDVERNVKLDDRAVLLYNRIYKKLILNPRIIIAG